MTRFSTAIDPGLSRPAQRPVPLGAVRGGNLIVPRIGGVPLQTVTIGGELGRALGQVGAAVNFAARAEASEQRRAEEDAKRQQERLAERMAAARDAVRLTDIEGQISRELFDATEEIRGLEPTDMEPAFDAKLEEIQRGIDDLPDGEIVKLGAQRSLSRLGTDARLGVLRSSVERQQQAAIGSLVANSQALLTQVGEGQVTADVAIERYAESVTRQVGITLTEKGAAIMLDDFGENAVREQYAALRPANPGAAAETMEGPLAKKYLSDTEREQRRSQAEREEEVQIETEAQAVYDAGARDVRELIGAEFVPDQATFEAEVNGLIDTMMQHPGFEVPGLFVRDKVASRADLRMLLLEPELKAAAANGLDDRFEIIAKSMPDTAEAKEIIGRSRRTLSAGTSGRALRESKQINEARIIGEWFTVADDAVTTGGLQNVPSRGIDYVAADGSTVNVSQAKIWQEVTEQAMVRLQEESEGEDETFARRVEWLSRNGVTWDRYEQVMAAGFAAMGNDFGTIEKNGVDALPANLMGGYDTFRRMMALNPRQLARHVKSEAVKNFYADAMLLEQFRVDTPAAALYEVARVVAKWEREGGFKDPLSDTVTAKQFREVMGREFSTGFSIFGLGNEKSANNPQEVFGKVERMARWRMAAYGHTPEVAIAAAEEDIRSTHTIINGYAVYTANQHTPGNLPALAEQIAKDYAERYGAAEGVEASDLALVPGETEGTWVLVIGSLGTTRGAVGLVEQFPEVGFYTNADLTRFHQANEYELGQETIRIQNQRVADREALLGTGSTLPGMGGLRIDTRTMLDPNRMLILEQMGGATPGGMPRAGREHPAKTGRRERRDARRRRAGMQGLRRIGAEVGGAAVGSVIPAGDGE